MWEYGRFGCLLHCVFLPCHPIHRRREHEDFREDFLHVPPSPSQPEQLCIGHNTGAIWPYLKGCLILQQIPQFVPVFHYMLPEVAWKETHSTSIYPIRNPINSKSCFLLPITPNLYRPESNKGVNLQNRSTICMLFT